LLPCGCASTTKSTNKYILTPTYSATEYILSWQLNCNTWAQTDKQKATAFAKHLASVFQPFPSQLSAMEEETITNELNAPHQMTLPMKKIRINEAKNVIKHKSHSKEAPGYDLITRNVLQELSQKGL